MATYHRLKELVDYTPETGEFRWARDYVGNEKGSVMEPKFGKLLIDGHWHSVAYVAGVLYEGPKMPRTVEYHRIDPEQPARVDNLVVRPYKALAGNKPLVKWEEKKRTRAAFYANVVRDSDKEHWRGRVLKDGKAKYTKKFKTIEEAEQALAKLVEQTT